MTPGIEVPQLEAVWPKPVRASLGLVGLLEAQLLQLARLQMQQKEEASSANDLRCAANPSKRLAKFEKETAEARC